MPSGTLGTELPGGGPRATVCARHLVVSAALQQRTMVSLGLLGMLNNLQKFGINKGLAQMRCILLETKKSADATAPNAGAPVRSCVPSSGQE